MYELKKAIEDLLEISSYDFNVQFTLDAIDHLREVYEGVKDRL